MGPGLGLKPDTTGSSHSGHPASDFSTFPLISSIIVSKIRRNAHIISILLAAVSPLPGALVHLKDGYIVTRSSAFVCLGRNRGFTFYGFVLPTSILFPIITYNPSLGMKVQSDAHYSSKR